MYEAARLQVVPNQVMILYLNGWNVCYSYIYRGIPNLVPLMLLCLLVVEL